MNSQNWQKVKDIFAEALNEPKENRLEFLRERSGADTEIFAEVESLLEAASDDSEPFIEKNAVNLAAKLKRKNYDFTKFGRYTVLREIGRGGMGAVFLAERNDGEFEQQAALKIIRQSFAGEEIERRFRRERQILASLNHPNIAKLLDGGVSDTGELFLVMEYVKGEPLTAFAEKNRLEIEDKLKLFVKVCRAISFAHQNLVVHRDIKPSNILVTKDAEPKLLDFGLAKITDDDFERTQTFYRAFTPSYASPEQIRGANITTASDIYSLGVVLYELLTSEKPFHFEGASLEEIARRVATDEPVRPSSFVPRHLPNENAAHPNEKRTKNKGRRTNSLKGDLDNIALKALQKEPERRYQSAEAFAEDIERHLKGLPVAARPATRAYRASKFFQRNKISVSAAAIILFLIVAGGIFSFVQFRQSEIERAKNEEVRTFLQKMLLTANSGGNPQTKGYSTSMNDMLEQAARRLDSDDFSKQPEVKAEIEKIIGDTFTSQGQYESAEKYLREALNIQIEIYGAAHYKVVLTNLSLAHLYLTKANYAEAEKIYERNLPAVREQSQQGNIEIAELVRALNHYALIRRAQGDSKQAEILFRENLTVGLQNDIKAADRNYIQTMIALTQFDQGKFDEAENEAGKLVELNRSQNNKELADALTLLGSIMTEKGDLKRAHENLREGEKIYRILFSPNAIPIYDNLRLQAQISYLSGNYEQAEAQMNLVLENYRQNSNPKYISFATALTLQGLILNKLGRSPEAETILREALRLRTENLPPKHFLTALTRGALGEILTASRKYAEAETLLLESLVDLKNLQAAENHRILAAENRLTELYKVWNKPTAGVKKAG